MLFQVGEQLLEAGSEGDHGRRDLLQILIRSHSQLSLATSDKGTDVADVRALAVFLNQGGAQQRVQYPAGQRAALVGDSEGIAGRDSLLVQQDTDQTGQSKAAPPRAIATSTSWSVLSATWAR